MACLCKCLTDSLLVKRSSQGLLSEEKKQTMMEKNMGFMIQKVKVWVNTYDLTDKGREYFSPEVDHFTGKIHRRSHRSGEIGPGFCYGTMKVAKIQRIQERGDSATVNFLFTIEDKPDWALAKEVVNNKIIVGEGGLSKVSRKWMKHNKGEVQGQARIDLKGDVWSYMHD